MRLLAIFCCVALATLLEACGESPAIGDVIGVWVNADGATLTLEESGQFSAKALPQQIFWRHDQPGYLDGKGTWTLVKGNPYWQVRLYFHEISGKPASREVPVLVASSGATSYLYQWEEGEGEARYRLARRR